MFLGSADWMTRNIDKRIELMFPVEDRLCKAKLMHALDAVFRDNVKARRLNADGTYRHLAPARGEPPYRVQLQLHEAAERAATVARDRAGIVLQPEAREPDHRKAV
jgi:polyphosphate kinase